MTNYMTKLGTAAIMALGLSYQALAAPIFQVTPSVLGGPGSTFTADQLSGGSSTLVTLNTLLNTGTATGWINFTGFTQGGSAVLSTGLNNNYQLWAEYTYTLTPQVSGATIGPFVDLFVTSMSVNVYGATGLTVTFNPTALSNFVTPTVNLNGATPKLIGTASLLGGVLEPTSQGGNAFNSTLSYTNTAFGSTFFTAPIPFFDIAFNEFNNTSQQILTSGNLVRVVSTGAVDFNRVPEPASLALLSIGLLSFGATVRRRKV